MEKKCICLADGFDYYQNQIDPSNCNYTCKEGWLLSTECGGESAFNVFLTDTTNLNDKNNCLSLQCGDPQIRDYPCNSSLPTICSALAFLQALPGIKRKNIVRTLEVIQSKIFHYLVHHCPVHSLHIMVQARVGLG